MSILDNANILVTGGKGFLGKYVCEALRNDGRTIYAPTSSIDFISRFDTKLFFDHCKPDLVFHLAGYNGGIKFNSDKPADIFARNTTMALNVLEACKDFKVKKVVSVVASCAYPEMMRRECEYAQPREIMWEEEFFDGPPHPSVACHGYAKRNLQLASKFYHDQYGLDAVCVCPTTLFGPGDSTDTQRTKVLMAVVKKVVDAKIQSASSITFWGSGNAYREFLFVEDAAGLIAKCADCYGDSSMPLNLGTGHEFQIRELVEKVVGMVGYTGIVEWDKTKPDGQLRKKLDLSRMKQHIPEFTPTNFDEALVRTINWYISTANPKSEA